MHLNTSGYSLVDFTENKELFNRVIFDIEGLRGLRAVSAKSYGKGDERRILMVVFPREAEPDWASLPKSIKQMTFPVK